MKITNEIYALRDCVHDLHENDHDLVTSVNDHDLQHGCDHDLELQD